MVVCSWIESWKQKSLSRILEERNPCLEGKGAVAFERKKFKWWSRVPREEWKAEWAVKRERSVRRKAGTRGLERGAFNEQVVCKLMCGNLELVPVSNTAGWTQTAVLFPLPCPQTPLQSVLSPEEHNQTQLL